jgi:hypothetical protein
VIWPPYTHALKNRRGAHKSNRNCCENQSGKPHVALEVLMISVGILIEYFLKFNPEILNLMLTLEFLIFRRSRLQTQARKPAMLTDVYRNCPAGK